MGEIFFILFCFLIILVLGHFHTNSKRKSYIESRPVTLVYWKIETGELEVRGLPML